MHSAPVSVPRIGTMLEGDRYNLWWHKVKFISKLASWYHSSFVASGLDTIRHSK